MAKKNGCCDIKKEGCSKTHTEGTAKHKKVGHSAVSGRWAVAKSDITRASFILEMASKLHRY